MEPDKKGADFGAHFMCRIETSGAAPTAINDTRSGERTSGSTSLRPRSNLTKMSTSGWRQESSANTTLAFWPPIGKTTETTNHQS